MKRKKSAVRIALVCGALGLLLCTVAGNAVNDVDRVLSWPEASIGNIAFFHVSGLRQYVKDEKVSVDKSSHTPSDMGDKQVYLDYKDIKNLDIDCEMGSVEIVYGKSFRMETYGLPERNTAKDSLSFEAYTENQTLYISVQSEKVHIGSSLKPRIKIIVPENMNSIHINQNAGLVKLSGIKGTSLEAVSDLGEVVLDRCEFDDIYAQSNMGQITLDRCQFDQGEFNNDLGSIDISGKTTGSLYAYSDGGSITLNLDQLIKDVSLDLSADLGEIKINGEKTEGSSYVSNSGNIQIHGEVDLGSIEANFQH